MDFGCSVLSMPYLLPVTSAVSSNLRISFANLITTKIGEIHYTQHFDITTRSLIEIEVSINYNVFCF